MFHLLVKASGAKLGENVLHRIALADLYDAGLGHMTQAERMDALSELVKTTVYVTTGSPTIKGSLKLDFGPMLAQVMLALDDRGDLEWRFSPTLLKVFENSDHWSSLERRAVMAFESKYSLRLYEIMALRAKLEKITSQRFELEDLRSRFGVPVGKLEEWFDFRRKVLEPAIAEVNQLAPFRISYLPIKRGRSVAAVMLSWGEKSAPERKATKRELDASKVGRKARRAGTVETVVTAPPADPFAEFPKDRISYTPWEKLALANMPPPGRDVDLVGNEFRNWCKNKDIPLKGPKVKLIFIGYCKKVKPAY
jgi:hypothetical protein